MRDSSSKAEQAGSSLRRQHSPEAVPQSVAVETVCHTDSRQEGNCRDGLKHVCTARANQSKAGATGVQLEQAGTYRSETGTTRTHKRLQVQGRNI